jgi:hypothetical protein
MSDATATAAWFAGALDRADAQQKPWRYWLLDSALPDDIARGIPDLPIEPMQVGDTYGKRETHNSTRVFFSVENRQKYSVCEALAQALQSPGTIRKLQARTGVDLTGSFLRIEYCQDTEGFWLEPHTDIGAKLYTMLVYLSDTPDSDDWGTDVYDGPNTWVGRAPGGFNRGLIFIPGHDTWHAVSKRHYSGVRKSIIVNYVVPEWRSRRELAFPDQAVT